jgi:hypothetical protein
VSKIFNKSEVFASEICAAKLQFRSPRKYNSEFSASIRSIVFSNRFNNSLGELGGLYQVPTKNGLDRGLDISIIRQSKNLNYYVQKPYPMHYHVYH